MKNSKVGCVSELRYNQNRYNSKRCQCASSLFYFLLFCLHQNEKVNQDRWNVHESGRRTESKVIALQYKSNVLTDTKPLRN